MSHRATPVSTAKGSKRNAQAVYQYTNTAHNRFRERLFLEKFYPQRLQLSVPQWDQYRKAIYVIGAWKKKEEINHYAFPRILNRGRVICCKVFVTHPISIASDDNAAFLFKMNMFILFPHRNTTTQRLEMEFSSMLKSPIFSCSCFSSVFKLLLHKESEEIMEIR